MIELGDQPSETSTETTPRPIFQNSRGVSGGAGGVVDVGWMGLFIGVQFLYIRSIFNSSDPAICPQATNPPA